MARPGPEPTRLVWDLTEVDLAEGEVVLPAGVDPKDLRVFVLDAEEPRIVTIARPERGIRLHMIKRP